MRSILHVADYAAPYSGNFIAEIRAIAAVSRCAGWRTAIALPTSAAHREWIGLLLADGIAVHFIPSPRRFLSTTQALAFIIGAEEAEIVHSHFNRRYEIATALARVLAGSRGIRLVWHRRSDGPFHVTAATQLKNFIGNRMLAPDARMIVLSHELRRQAIATGIGRESITDSFHGVDVERVNSLHQSRAEVRADLCLAADARVALMFGWDPKVKGVDLALDAARRVADDQPKFVLAMVGWEATIQAINAMFGDSLPTWLRVLPPIENIADYYHAVDVMLSTSRYEGFSGAMAEAMSTGLPVVATDIPGVQWAKASVGVCFTAMDAESIATGIKQILDASPERTARWRDANRELIKESYSLNSMANRVCNLYLSMFRSHAAGDLAEMRT